jgi:thiamine-phosphate pyrophosphorylase
MITDPKFKFNEILEAVKKHKPTFVCYRNKEYYDKNEIIKFAKFAKNYSKTFINYDSLKEPELLELFDGIHLPSSKIELIDNFKNKITITSTHSVDEVLKASNSDYITFSPIFESKGRKGVGVEKLNEICKLHDNVIALGGIVSEKEIKEIKNSCAKGFASIRYFFT